MKHLDAKKHRRFLVADLILVKELRYRAITG